MKPKYIDYSRVRTARMASFIIVSGAGRSDSHPSVGLVKTPKDVENYLEWFFAAGDLRYVSVTKVSDVPTCALLHFEIQNDGEEEKPVWKIVREAHAKVDEWFMFDDTKAATNFLFESMSKYAL